MKPMLGKMEKLKSEQTLEKMSIRCWIIWVFLLSTVSSRKTFSDESHQVLHSLDSSETYKSPAVRHPQEHLKKHVLAACEGFFEKCASNSDCCSPLECHLDSSNTYRCKEPVD